MEDLLERIVAIARALDAAGIPHSFGGAIALGFYAEARLTHDIDLNVYLEVSDAGRALETLAELGVPAPNASQRNDIARRGQTRLRWDGVPLDLFFSNLAFHASCAERRRRFELLGQTVDVLSAEDLVVCKVAFGRAKDGRDIETLLDALGTELDAAYVLRWAEEIVSADAPALVALRAALEARALLPAG